MEEKETEHHNMRQSTEDGDGRQGPRDAGFILALVLTSEEEVNYRRLRELESVRRLARAVVDDASPRRPCLRE